MLYNGGSLATTSVADENKSAAKIKEHLRRIASNRLCCQVFIGNKKEADEALQVESNEVMVLSTESSWKAIADDSILEVKLSTRLWGSQVILLLDPLVGQSGVNKLRGNFTEMLNITMCCSCDMLSVVLLPSSATFASPAVTLDALSAAIADIQMDFSGVQFPNAWALSLLHELSIAQPSSAHKMIPTNSKKLPFNLNISIRLFLNDKDFQAKSFGDQCEVL